MYLNNPGNIIFLITFSALLLILCVFCFVKKRYLEFFFPAILLLPDFYGFSLSYALPLFTVKRLLFIILYIYIFVFYRKSIISSFRTIRFNSATIYLLLYFITRLVANLYYVTTFGQAIKTIFSIVFEQLFLLFAINIIRPSGKQFISVIKAVAYSLAVFFVMGIIESISCYRIVDALYTVNRLMHNDHYIRAGLLRATVSMGLPGFFGQVCVLAVPLFLLLYNQTKQKRYLFFISLAILACAHSGSRSSFIFLFVPLSLGVLPFRKNAQEIKKYVTNVIIILCSTILLVTVLSVAGRKNFYYYEAFGKSVLNVFGFNFSLDIELDGEPTIPYGKNLNPNYSRLSQFSGMLYTAKVNPVFGLGSGAQIRGDIRYYYNSVWVRAFTYDVGLVELFCDEGILGTIGYLSLFIFLIISLLSRIRGSAFIVTSKYLLLCIITYLICTLSTANMETYLFTFVSLIIALPQEE